MSWENYGEWHIDHKAPLKYNKPSLEKVAQRLHYTNTQPMWQVKICRKAVDIFLAKPTLNKYDKLYKKNPIQLYSLVRLRGKTHFVLELIENYYSKTFDYIIIISPTLPENSTYHAKEWIKTDYNVSLEDPKDKLYQWIKTLS